MSSDVYDFIIVGAGSAGCVLANRLSADPGNRVLLLEAGGNDHPLARLPVSYSLFIDKPGVNWRYFSQPEPATAGRQIPVPRGRMLGGSSSINGLVFVRGQAEDYDGWAALGNDGWSFDDLLPMFQKMEDFSPGDSPRRAKGGPLKVSVAADPLAIYETMFQAGEELGIARNPDYNGDAQEGLCKTQTTIHNGRRMSASFCYLRPARKRPNLNIETNAFVRRLVLKGKQCTGVEYQRDGKLVTVSANRDVILSAGSINSPQLLELSGIGQPDVLKANGIEVRHSLVGVGENLRDHYAPRMSFQINDKRSTYNGRVEGLGLGWQLLRYALTKKGFVGIPSAPMLGFIKSRPNLTLPDLQIHFVPFTVKNIQKRQLGREPGMTLTFYQLRPRSTGSVHIQSDDYTRHPLINFNFLSDPVDRQCMVDGVRKMRELVATQAMASMRGDWIKPQNEVETDEQILDWVSATAETAYHPIGTCKMGVASDETAVVDPNLRVHGIGGLRVADGSIMPTMVSGNTNAACLMIGEKAAELVQTR